MKKGETVPDFEAINQEGASVSLSAMFNLVCENTVIN